MSKQNPVFRRTVTYTCGAEIGISSNSKLLLDKKADEFSKRKCPMCQLKINDVTTDEMELLLAHFADELLEYLQGRTEEWESFQRYMNSLARSN